MKCDAAAANKPPRNDCVSARIKSLGSKLERGFQIAENWSQCLYIKRSSSADLAGDNMYGTLTLSKRMGIKIDSVRHEWTGPTQHDL
jgi:hypothetical protein